MRNKPRFRAAADAITLGIAFPACIVAGYFLGKGADKLFGWAPYGSYVGGALGIFAGFWNLYKISREADDEDRGKPVVKAPETILRRVEKTALILSIAGASVAFAAFGSRAAVSLTIGAAIVIFNFFVLEKVMGGFLTPRTGMRFSDVVVPAAGFLGILLLLTAVLRWKGFDLFAGLAGLSVIVLAIVWEGLRGFRE